MWRGAGRRARRRPFVPAVVALEARTVPAALYHVFPATATGPDVAGRALLADPADLRFSPFGWHDTNGQPGAEFTDTRGNNAVVQDDADSDNAGGFRPDGGPGLRFDFPFDAALDAAGNRAAALTNAFYLANRAHDLFAAYGFTEAAGNFQTTNYSGQGLGGDALQIDVQEGTGNNTFRNNANITVPADGRAPRLQIGIFDQPAAVKSNSPGVASLAAVGVADFGPSLYRVTGNLVMANPPQATGPLTNDVQGKIVLIDRGMNLFVEKVKRAQDAGAIAVIIADNQPGPAISLGGSDPSITIPAVRVTQADGNALKAALTAGATVNLTVARAAPRDGAFDSTLVFHYYGQAVATRLTGDPAGVGKLAATQSAGMSRGWGDFFALMLTQKTGD
jgi:hypothetical protein